MNLQIIQKSQSKDLKLCRDLNQSFQSRTEFYSTQSLHCALESRLQAVSKALQILHYFILANYVFSGRNKVFGMLFEFAFRELAFSINSLNQSSFQGVISLSNFALLYSFCQFSLQTKIKP
jgi:hypothetical protein